MAKLTFEYTETNFVNDNRDVQKVELEIPDDLNIYEFKQMCCRLALSLGYQPKTIKKSFGDSDRDKEEKQKLRRLLNDGQK